MSDITADLISIKNETSGVYTVFRMRKYTPQVSPLYANATRNMAGSFRGSLIGNFTVLTLSAAPMTATEMASLQSLLLQPSFHVAYLDAETNSVKTEVFHLNGNSTPVLLQRQSSMYDEYPFELAANNKRSW